MPRFWLVLALIAVAFWIFVLVDCIRTPKTATKSLPKWAWLVLMIVFPIVGSVLWLVFGKDRAAMAGPRTARRGPIAPDDDPSFLNSLDRQKREDERIADLERRLAELDDDPSRTEEGGDGQNPAGGPRRDA